MIDAFQAGCLVRHHSLLPISAGGLRSEI